MPISPFFAIVKKDEPSLARAGSISTPNGVVPTPAFMPVGTRATVKAMAPDDLRAGGATIVLANALHLYLRPGLDLLRSFGGIRKFMGWTGPVLTDSGGYQVYSLSNLRKIEPEGATFRSPYDGSLIFFSPKTAIEAQVAIGSDIMMCLDECVKYPASFDETEKSLALTMDWAEKSREAWDEKSGQALFGIVQGGFYPELRAKAASAIKDLDFPGHAIGGLALGEPMAARLLAIETAQKTLPPEKPLYLMGLGTPEDLIEGVRRGADLFDCVIPTRNARNGQLFTSFGRINLLNARHREDQSPPDPSCQCPTCRTFSRAYLRHLLKNREPLYPRLSSIHNLTYYHSLLAGARKAILEGNFTGFSQDFYAKRDSQNKSPDP